MKTTTTAFIAAATTAALLLGTGIAIASANAAPSSSSERSLPSADELNARIDAALAVLNDQQGRLYGDALSTEDAVERAITLYLASDGIADESARAELLTEINASKQAVEDAHVLHLRVIWLITRNAAERGTLDHFGLSEMAHTAERLATLTTEFATPDLTLLTAASSAVVITLTSTLPEVELGVLPADATTAERLESLVFSLPFTVEQVAIGNGCGISLDAWGCYDPRDSGGLIRITEAGLALTDGELRAVIAHEQRHHQQLEASVYIYSGTELVNRAWIEADAYPFGDRFNPDL